ncbi:unnamed protein product [Candidula unifasciata]|uniref:Protein SMG9 n=1 Tax=Candidula unifasciata TaxID=100452 RepID=A0A8S3YPM5_9EUPU|nr:unnamed protein product [Candidula unifasciata]
MADSYDRHRRRRRRDRLEYGRHSEDVSPAASKPPVTILGLAKPTRSSIVSTTTTTSTVSTTTTTATTMMTGSSVGDNVVNIGTDPDVSDNVAHQLLELTIDAAPGTDKTSVVTEGKPRLTAVKSAELDSTEIPRSQLEESSHTTDDASVGMTRRVSAASTVGNIISGVIDQSAQTQLKLAPPLEKQTTVKMIDSSFQWTDSGHDLMLDHTDLLVVGIIGLQGCGKSTLLSLLAGNTNQDAYRNYVFFPQTKEAKEDCLYQTSGVDMFVSTERIILLDTQPLVSVAMMDGMLRYERKIPPEYSSHLNFIEVQSVQLLTFMLSVCNVILVADDWFIDLNLLKVIQDAEMLKPSTQASSSTADNSSTREDGLDFYPTVIFIHNKACRDDFTPEAYFSMQQVLLKMFSSSKLKIKSGITMTSSILGEPLIQPLPGTEESEARDVNLLLIPTMEFYKSEPDFLETTLPEYRGYPSFSTILSFFRAQILSSPRSPMTNTILSEKNWYHFAARMWESVKKSSLIAEYNRLLASTS